MKRTKLWKHIAGTAAIVTILVGIVQITGSIPGCSPDSPEFTSNTVTVLVHGEKSKQESILPGRGIVKLIYGDAIVSEQINNEGEVTFKQVPEQFFGKNALVEILFQDPEGEPYVSMYPDSLYRLTKGKYISLPVKLQGLNVIQGVVIDFETGEPVEGARIRVRGEETFSNQYGEYILHIPPEKQLKYQTVRAFKEGYHPFEYADLTPQTGRGCEISMKPKK